MSENIQVHLVPTLCPLAVSPFDFSKSKELMERAAQSTQKWIEDGGLTRRSLRSHRIVIEFEVLSSRGWGPDIRLARPALKLLCARQVHH